MPTSASDGPWLGDACSLVDAFRAGDRSPVEEVEAVLAAIDATDLNCFSHVDADRALAAARTADVSLPFGGVPAGIKELDHVEGWPDTEASLVFRDRKASYTSTMLRRLFEAGGANPVGLTTASEFGGLNVSVSKLNGVCHNPWQRGRTAGGSSGGSAAAVAGGLVSLATGGDGGGSIRIPAGYNGVLGMKGTFGRIPRGPHAYMRPNTVVLGNLARSVRDAARFYDVCAGADGFDATSLPSAGGWEAGLGSTELRGLRVAVVPALGGVTLDAGVEDHLRAAAKQLLEDTGMVEVDLDVSPPNLTAQWMLGNLATLRADLGSRWPGCAGDLTDEIALSVPLAQAFYNLDSAATGEQLRIEANEVMARAFESVDLIIAATNPGPAFPAEATTSASERTFIDALTSSDVARLGARGLLFGVRVLSALAPKLPGAVLGEVARRFPDVVGMGALTIISNIYGNPAVSIPVGTVGGLPVGMQVLAPHHRDAALFDVALAVERERPWPLVAPSVGVKGSVPTEISLS